MLWLIVRKAEEQRQASSSKNDHSRPERMEIYTRRLTLYNDGSKCLYKYIYPNCFITSAKLLSGGQALRLFGVGWNNNKVYYCGVLFIYTIHVMFINLQLTWGIWSRHTVSSKLCTCYPSELYRSQGEVQSVGTYPCPHDRWVPEPENRQKNPQCLHLELGRQAGQFTVLKRDIMKYSSQCPTTLTHKNRTVGLKKTKKKTRQQKNTVCLKTCSETSSWIQKCFGCQFEVWAIVYVQL